MDIVDGSPRRSWREPMAFGLGEFCRGALRAWAWYLLSVAVVAAAYGSINLVVMALMWATPISFVATLVWAPVAYAVGRVLRRVRRTSTHVIAFTAVGAVSGAVTMCLFLLAFNDLSSADPSGLAFFAPFALTPSVVVPLAWWRTMRLALRADRDGPPAPRPDPDARAEDAAVIRLTENPGS